jgi:glycosyltransferase involved in cell wall biosynthesis
MAEYGGAHLLVLPSRPPEALPSVVTEALLTGLPVLASRVGGVPTQVRDAGLLVSTSDSESLVPAIEKMIADYPAFAERAVVRGHEMGVDYSIDQMIDNHLALYRRLLAERSRA